MAKKRSRLDHRNEAGDVVSQFASQKVVWKKERLQTIKLLLETELTYEEVAGIVGRHPSRVKKWAKDFREGGLAALLVRGNGGGCKGRMTVEAKEALLQCLREGRFRTAPQIKGWLAEEFKIELSVKGVYYQLGKLKGRLKVPRPSHLKKDEDKERDFRVTLAEKLLALEIPKQKKVRLWVYDEMRYGLHPLVRKMWSLVGHRVVSPVNRRFEWGYLFGALEVSSGESEFLFTDGVVKEFDRAFLEQIARQDPDSQHVVIGDGAGFHHREGSQNEEPLPANLKILTLPPYSPELNPVEKLWDIVKDGICTRCWETLAELEEKITSELRSWWEKAEGFSSLFRTSYLRTELNDLNY